MGLNIRIEGNAMQMAVMSLARGQTVYSEPGKFLFSSGDVSMETKLSAPVTSGESTEPPAGGGGKFGGLLRTAVDAGKRALAGESLTLCHFTGVADGDTIAFAGVTPGELRVLELDGATTWLAEKDAFVVAEAGVNLDIAFSGFATGMFGGEGFILEKFTGRGSLVVGGAGNFIDLNPADFGGRLKVDTGCIVAFEDTVNYAVERVGRLNRTGVANAMFGGEGLRLATLTGNGRVILQSMTLGGLAMALAKASHQADGKGNGVSGFGAIGNFFGGTRD